MMAGMIPLIITSLLRVLRTRSAPRPRLRRSDRLVWVLLSQLWNGWADAVARVQPETVIRW